MPSIWRSPFRCKHGNGNGRSHLHVTDGDHDCGSGRSSIILYTYYIKYRGEESSMHRRCCRLLVNIIPYGVYYYTRRSLRVNRSVSIVSFVRLRRPHTKSIFENFRYRSFNLRFRHRFIRDFSGFFIIFKDSLPPFSLRFLSVYLT